MSEINVISRTQKIIVDPFSSAVSVINAGPQGPGGPIGEVSLALLASELADNAADSTALLNAHLSDLTDAHDASAISILDDEGVFAGDNVEDALREAIDTVPILRFPDPVVTGTLITLPDPTELAGALALDIRWIERGRPSTGSGWMFAQAASSTAGNCAFLIQGISLGRVSAFTSTGGAAGVNNISAVDLRPADGVVASCRMTWRASDGRVQYFKKNTTTIAALKSNAGWTQVGTTLTGAVGALTNVALPFTINGSSNLVANLAGFELKAVQISTTIDAPPFAEFISSFQALNQKLIKDQFNKEWNVRVAAGSKLAIVSRVGNLLAHSAKADTGWRNITTLLTGKPASFTGAVQIRRIEDKVILRVNTIQHTEAAAIATVTWGAAGVPVGWRASTTTMQLPVLRTNGLTTAGYLPLQPSTGVIWSPVVSGGSWSPSISLSGEVSWITDDPWPQTVLGS